MINDDRTDWNTKMMKQTCVRERSKKNQLHQNKYNWTCSRDSSQRVRFR